MTLLAGQVSEHGARVVHSTRSSSVTFDLDSPREVHSRTGHSYMVVRVIVTCSWNTGGYNLLRSPAAYLRCDEEEWTLFASDLVSIPDWLSDLIAAGTPTDLEHPAS